MNLFHVVKLSDLAMGGRDRDPPSEAKSLLLNGGFGALRVVPRMVWRSPSTATQSLLSDLSMFDNVAPSHWPVLAEDGYGNMKHRLPSV